jgi:hypothetical protein
MHDRPTTYIARPLTGFCYWPVKFDRFAFRESIADWMSFFFFLLSGGKTRKIAKRVRKEVTAQRNEKSEQSERSRLTAASYSTSNNVGFFRNIHKT